MISFSSVAAETGAVFSYILEFEGPKSTSGFELMDRIATFYQCFFRNPCQITEPRVVMRSWWIVGVAGCSPACFASSLELKQHVCARKTSHLLLKKSHLNLWHNLMDYCAALHAKFNANFYMMCLGPTHLDLKDQPFEHNCASFLNVTISSYNQLRNTEDNSQRPHKADGRKSSCDKSIY